MRKDKNAIITGSSKGIGLFISEVLAKEGVNLILCARSNSELSKAKTQLKKYDVNVYTIVADVSKFSDCKKVIQLSTKKFKTIDILVNNAGIYGPIGELESNDIRLWEKAIKINLMGTVYFTKLILPFMKKQRKGKIINLAGAGVGGGNVLDRFSSYFSSKAAVAAFTEVVANEVESFSIQINAISPGGINTGLTDYLISQGKSKAGEDMYRSALSQMKDRKTQNIQLKKLRELVIFLCSEKSSHINGRLLSAKWDDLFLLENKKISPNKFTLRRIDNILFGEKK